MCMVFPSAAYLLIHIIFIFLETSGTVWQTQIAGQTREGGGGQNEKRWNSPVLSSFIKKGNEEWQERKESKEKRVQKNCRRKANVTFNNKKRLHTRCILFLKKRREENPFCCSFPSLKPLSSRVLLPFLTMIYYYTFNEIRMKGGNVFLLHTTGRAIVT